MDVQRHHTLALSNMPSPGHDCLFHLTYNYYGNICVFCMCAMEQRCDVFAKAFSPPAAGTLARISD